MKIERRRSRNIFKVLWIILIVNLIIVVGLSAKIQNDKTYNLRENDTTENEESASESSAETEKESQNINFQPIIDEWVKTAEGDQGIWIYDLERKAVVGAHNEDKKFATASLYKLFVVYEGYRRLDSKEWDKKELVGTTGRTLLKCLDLAIRESNSACAEAMWAKIGDHDLEEIVKNDFNIHNSSVSGLTSTPKDVGKMMQLFYDHPEIKDDSLVEQIKDSFLNQPVTEYNWRQGLPSSFSQAKVYNKVGWEFDKTADQWRVYNDAAIVEYPDRDRHFIVIMMTEQTPLSQIREFGEKIEEAFLE